MVAGGGDWDVEKSLGKIQIDGFRSRACLRFGSALETAHQICGTEYCFLAHDLCWSIVFRLSHAKLTVFSARAILSSLLEML